MTASVWPAREKAEASPLRPAPRCRTTPALLPASCTTPPTTWILNTHHIRPPRGELIGLEAPRQAVSVPASSTPWQQQQHRPTTMPPGSTPTTTHRGGCHCKAVRWEFSTQQGLPLVAWDCTCSICRMKRNTHVFIPEADFVLLQGADNLSCYQFETGVAKHLFCKTCGVCSYYRPRSNPDTYAVTVHCVDADTPLQLAGVRLFDGVHWEDSYAATNIGRVASSSAAAAAVQQQSPAAAGTAAEQQSPAAEQV